MRRIAYCATLSIKHIGCQSFSVESLTIWNALPDDLRDLLRSVSDFRWMLKTALFARYRLFRTIQMPHEIVLYKFNIDIV